MAQKKKIDVEELTKVITDFFLTHDHEEIMDYYGSASEHEKIEDICDEAAFYIADEIIDHVNEHMGTVYTEIGTYKGRDIIPRISELFYVPACKIYEFVEVSSVGEVAIDHVHEIYFTEDIELVLVTAIIEEIFGARTEYRFIDHYYSKEHPCDISLYDFEQGVCEATGITV